MFGFVNRFTHQPLNRENRVLRVNDSLPFSRLADKALIILVEGNHRWGRSPTFSIGDDNWFATLKHSDNRIGRAEVNTNNFTHDISSYSRKGTILSLKLVRQSNVSRTYEIHKIKKPGC